MLYMQPHFLVTTVLQLLRKILFCMGSAANYVGPDTTIPSYSIVQNIPGTKLSWFINIFLQILYRAIQFVLVTGYTHETFFRKWK